MQDDDVVRQLAELAELRTSGMLSDEEFRAAKHHLLDRPVPGPPPGWPGSTPAAGTAGPVPMVTPLPDDRRPPSARPRVVLGGLVAGVVTVLLVVVVLVATGYLGSGSPAVTQPLSPGVPISVPASSGDPLPAPTPLSPASGTEFSHFPRDTTVTWTPVNGATGYEVTVQFDGSPGNGAWSGTPEVVAGGATQFSFSFVGAQPGRWRVAAVDAAGRVGLPSGWSYFSYTR